MKQYATLEDTVYFWFAGNDTSGSGGDGASPAADVRLAGAAADAPPVFSPTPVLLTNAGYPDGCYELAVAATNTNGFAANNTYAVYCTLAIDSQNPTGFIGSFDLKPINGLAKVASDLASVLIDTAELQTDDIPASIAAIAATALSTGTWTDAKAAFIDAAISDSAQASVCTEARLAELAAANLPSDIDTLLVDVAEVESDLATVDTVVDAIKAKTDNLPADPADDSDIDAQLAAIKAETVLIVADTDELQTDDIPGTLSTIAGYLDAEIAAILADTDELQSDWENGGRLDNILDAAGSAGDPWITELPGAYTAGQAGYIIPNIESDLNTVVIVTAAIKDKTDSISGTGSKTWPYILTRSATGQPIAGATVWVSSDSDGATVLASGITNSTGTVVFFLDPATVYVWRQATGFSFENPDTEVVS